MPLLISLLALNSLLNFYLVDGPSSLSVRLAENRQATASVSAKVLVSAWLDSPLWGQGLDNFGRSFSLFRPASLNTSPYWDLRLERAFSTLFDWLIATGLIGLLALAFFIYRLAPALFSDFRAKKPDTEVQTLRTLSAFALVLILVVFVFCSANANLFFWAAVFFALYFSEKAQPAVFSGSREPGPLRLKLLAALAALWLFILIQNIYAFKFLLADWSLIEKDPDQKTLERSFRFSPRFEHTLRLAAFHARQAEAARASSQLDQSLAEQDQALNLLEKAEKNGSFSVLAMETVAAIYRDFSEGGDGLNLMAKQAFAKAVALEPSNPVLLNEYGQSLLQARDFSEAKKIFEQTLVAKPDYSPAEFGLAKALAGSGQADEALARLLRLSKEANDADIYYEMGLIYFNEERYPEARKVFESAISLAPLNSNALYGLALALEKTGEKDEALYYFKKVQKINPNNREISEKIKNLEK
jgi:tetratricopeptide (TPR) repeat protein